MGSRFLILVRFPQQPNSWQNNSAFSPSSFVFALHKRKNEGQKMESAMLPQAERFIEQDINPDLPATSNVRLIYNNSVFAVEA
jgi:hypothetical protein